MHILIIGAGWAGIAAAIAAAERGWHVTLIEERPYIGGRARSFVDRDTGDEIDNGQHVMMGAYTAANHVMKSLGTSHYLERQQALRVAFADADGQRDVLDASIAPGRAGMLFGILRLSKIRPASRYAAIKLAIRISRKQANTKGRTCLEFLQEEHQPPDVLERFWEPLVLATLNAPMNKAAASLMENVLRIAVMGGKGSSSLWIPTVGLSKLLSPLPDWLAQHGGSLHTSVSADTMESEGGLVRRVHLSNGNVLEPDAVVCAVPHRALQRLLNKSAIHISLPPEPVYSPIVSVYLWYDVDWMPFDFTAALGTTIQWVFNKRRIKPGLVALTISAAAEAATQHATDFLAQCHQELRRLFPEALSANMLHGVVIKEKQATPLITPQFEECRRAMQTCSGNLALCSDWSYASLPATIEAAARSGFRAVQELEHLSSVG